MNHYDRLLRKEVEKLFGQQITNATHCELLSKAVLLSTNISVSAQTFRRFWEIIEYKNKVSTQSKNALCKYLGYADYNEFIAHYNQNKNKTVKEIDFDIIQQLFTLNKITTSDYQLWQEGVQTVIAQIIFSDKKIFESFVTKLHNNPSAMEYIIGWHQCYHLLSKDWYIKGLRVFCNHSKISHHQLYLYSLEATACLFQNKRNDIKIWIDKIKKIMPKVKAEYYWLFPLEGAINGLMIVYYNSINDDMRKTEIIQQSEQIFLAGKGKINEYGDSNGSFITNIIEILIWSGLYQDANYFLEKFGEEYLHKRYYQFTLAQSNKIYKALMYLQNNKPQKAALIFPKIQMDEMRFDKKPLLEALYLLLKFGLTPVTAKVKKEKLKTQLISACNNNGFHNIISQIPKFESCL